MELKDLQIVKLGLEQVRTTLTELLKDCNSLIESISVEDKPIEMLEGETSEDFAKRVTEAKYQQDIIHRLNRTKACVNLIVSGDCSKEAKKVYAEEVLKEFFLDEATHTQQEVLKQEDLQKIQEEISNLAETISTTHEPLKFSIEEYLRFMGFVITDYNTILILEILLESIAPSLGIVWDNSLTNPQFSSEILQKFLNLYLQANQLRIMFVDNKKTLAVDFSKFPPIEANRILTELNSRKFNPTAQS